MSARSVPDRVVASAIIDMLAGQDTSHARYSPCSFYDDDAEMTAEICELLKERTGVDFGKQSHTYLHRRFMRVCNRLENFRALNGKALRNPDHQYIGEPIGWKDFWLANPSTAKRLRPDLYPDYKNDCNSGPEFEMDWLLRHAYPKPDKQRSS